MKKNLTVPLDEKVYQRLLDNFGGDEKALQDAAARALENRFPEPGETKIPSPDDPKGLEDYLKKGASGGKSYGIKGQGW
ncbi:MAG: hypothetical protein V3U37_02155 [Nitrospinaceae bacterium]